MPPPSTLDGLSVAPLRCVEDDLAEALTQCWFTRIHLPERHRHREADGSINSTCRYCHKPIVSWNRDSWTLATGFDVSRLAETASGRHLSLYDREGDFVLHRYPVAHLNDEAAIDAFKDRLRGEYGLDHADSTLELRDSARPARSHRKPTLRAHRSAPLRMISG